jgi:GNAT superfamily N-acetyltransferase
VPQRRGRGIGRQLLQLLLELADQTGLRCYLDTYNESILPFYASNGFRVAALGRASPNSPTIWGMLRDRARDILLR